LQGFLLQVEVSQMHEACEPNAVVDLLDAELASRVRGCAIRPRAGRTSKRRSTAIELLCARRKQCARPAMRMTIGCIGDAVPPHCLRFLGMPDRLLLQPIAEVSGRPCHFAFVPIGKIRSSIDFSLSLQRFLLRVEPHDVQRCQQAHSRGQEHHCQQGWGGVRLGQNHARDRGQQCPAADRQRS
jgi:hypothetical protein